MGDDRWSPGAALTVAVAALAAVALTVWGGAAAAGVLAGHRFRGRFRQGLTAAIHLPHHLADPAAAWPTGARAGLPGPGLYWIATTVVAVLAVAGTAVCMPVVDRRRVGTRRRRRLGEDTRARLAGGKDIAPLIVPGPVRYRFIVGAVERRLVATEDRRFAPATSRAGRVRQGDRGAVALIGPSRCGKSADVVAGVLDWDGPAVLSSTKSDLLDATLARRSRLGEVRVFDPTDLFGRDVTWSETHITDPAGILDRPTAQWFPLRAAQTVTGAQRAARLLINSSPEIVGAEDLGFFVGKARQLLWTLLYAGANDGRPMADVVSWVCGNLDEQRADVSAIFDRLLVSADSVRRRDVQLAYRVWIGVLGYDYRTVSGILAQAALLLDPWLDPVVSAHAQRCDIDLAWLTSGPNTLYICAPLDEQDRLAAVFGTLLADLMSQAYDHEATTGGPICPTVFVMDEAGNTPLRNLPQIASTCAGIGVLLVTVWQSVAQIQRAYGRAADAVLTNHLTKVFFSGISDEATLRYASWLIGQEEVTQRAASHTVAGGRAETVNDTAVRVDLVPHDILRLTKPLNALLVHGSLRPAHMVARAWYKERRLANLAKGAGPDPVAPWPTRATDPIDPDTARLVGFAGDNATTSLD